MHRRFDSCAGRGQRLFTFNHSPPGTTQQNFVNRSKICKKCWKCMLSCKIGFPLFTRGAKFEKLKSPAPLWFKQDVATLRTNARLTGAYATRWCMLDKLMARQAVANQRRWCVPKIVSYRIVFSGFSSLRHPCALRPQKSYKIKFYRFWKDFDPCYIDLNRLWVDFWLIVVDSWPTCGATHR